MKDNYTVTYETAEGLSVQLTGDFDDIHDYMNAKRIPPHDVDRFETTRKKAAALTLLLNDYEAGADAEELLHTIRQSHDLIRGDDI